MYKQTKAPLFKNSSYLENFEGDICYRWTVVINGHHDVKLAFYLPEQKRRLILQK